MNCEGFRDRAIDFLDGTLADRAAFEAHAASCQACAATLRGIESNVRVLSAARAPVAPADLWPRIAAAVSAGRTPEFRRPRILAFFAAAAALLLVAGLFLSLAAPAPTVDLVVVDGGAALRGLVPAYGDVDPSGALVDTLFRRDF